MNIEKLLKKLIEDDRKKWDNVYILVDIHGTVLKPSWSNTKESFEYYDYAKESLRVLSKIPNVVLILWSSSYYSKLLLYQEKFKKDEINFRYINENPEVTNGDYTCFDIKPYCDLGIDDKFGFSPESWEDIYKYYLVDYEESE